MSFTRNSTQNNTQNYIQSIEYPLMFTSFHRGLKRYYLFREGEDSKTIFSTTTPRRATILHILADILILAALIGFLIISIPEVFNRPQKLNTFYDNEIVIEDNARVISADEKESLKATLRFFREKTGITPVIITTDEFQMGAYTNLSEYVKNRYQHMFGDEKHWIIAYSMRRMFGNLDWDVASFYGDEVTGVLTTPEEKACVEEIKDYIKAGDSFYIALTKSVTNTTGTVMGMSVNWGFVWTMGLFTTLLIIALIVIIASMIRSRIYIKPDTKIEQK